MRTATFVEQFIQIKRGGNVFADLRHHCQMVSAHLQFTIQARPIDRNRNRIGQRSQNKQVIRVERFQLVRLHIQNTQNMVFNF